MAEQNQEKKEIQIRITEDAQKGRYANIMRVHTTREEFILDFGVLHPADATGVVTDRIYMSPGHAKRMLIVLQRVLDQYEKQHGSVESAAEEKEIGFKTA